jgi:hypothetical protein
MRVHALSKCHAWKQGKCDFSKIDDDGIDILANYTRVTAQKDPRTLVVKATNIDHRPGDRVELWDWRHKKKRSEAVVVGAQGAPGGLVELTLDRDVVTERVGAGEGNGDFSRAAIVDGIDRLINVATVGQRTIIRDSKFQVFRAKCLNLKAAHCTVERCTFTGSFQPAVFASPEWYFEEGSAIRNFTVRDCVFTDNNHPNIVIGASPIAGLNGAKPAVSERLRAACDITYHGSTIWHGRPGCRECGVKASLKENSLSLRQHETKQLMAAFDGWTEVSVSPHVNASQAHACTCNTHTCDDTCSNCNSLSRADAHQRVFVLELRGERA